MNPNAVEAGRVLLSAVGVAGFGNIRCCSARLALQRPGSHYALCAAWSPKSGQLVSQQRRVLHEHRLERRASIKGFASVLVKRGHFLTGSTRRRLQRHLQKLDSKAPLPRAKNDVVCSFIGYRVGKKKKEWANARNRSDSFTFSRL